MLDKSHSAASFGEDEMRGLARFLTPAAQQGEACKTEEREGGRLGNQVDLNREGVGASKVGVPEAIEGVAHSACLVEIEIGRASGRERV